jgi:hypothetical protein
MSKDLFNADEWQKIRRSYNCEQQLLTLLKQRVWENVELRMTTKMIIMGLIETYYFIREKE